MAEGNQLLKFGRKPHNKFRDKVVLVVFTLSIIFTGL